MTINLVTVTITAQGSPVDTATPDGNFMFTPSGTGVDLIADVAVAPRIQQGHLVNGAGSVQIIASDSYAAGVLTWDITINIRDLRTICAEGVVINFSDGATQGVFDILTAAGWTPLANP